MTAQEAMRRFQAADDAWHAALEARYGSAAGDARYDPARNGEREQHTALARTSLAFRQAAAAYAAAKRAEAAQPCQRPGAA